jgi:hypothetical protein
LAILALLLFAYAAAYAKYYDFGGDVAWGHRFVLLPVQLLCLFAVPLLLRRRAPALWLLVGASVILQIASTLISPSVEIRQRNMGFSQGVLWNRAVNLEQIARNREDPRRFAGIPPELRTLSYFPFQLRFRFQALAGWAIAAWTVLLLAVPVLLVALWRQARLGAGPPAFDP